MPLNTEQKAGILVSGMAPSQQHVEQHGAAACWLKRHVGDGQKDQLCDQSRRTVETARQYALQRRGCIRSHHWLFRLGRSVLPFVCRPAAFLPDCRLPAALRTPPLTTGALSVSMSVALLRPPLRFPLLLCPMMASRDILSFSAAMAMDVGPLLGVQTRCACNVCDPTISIAV